MKGRGNADELLDALLERGVITVIVEGRLRLDAPAGTLDAEVRGRLADALPDLRELVDSLWRSREQCWANRPCRRMSVCQEMKRDPGALRAAGMIACGIPAVCALCRNPLPPDHRYLCAPCAEKSRARALATRGPH